MSFKKNKISPSEILMSTQTERAIHETMPKRRKWGKVKSIVHTKRFFARSQSEEHDIKTNIYSLHGYSSMRMMQDGPKACANKVSTRNFSVNVIVH